MADKFNIQAVPTFLFLQNGEVTNTVQGVNMPAIHDRLNSFSVLAAASASDKAAEEEKEEVVGGEEADASAAATDKAPEDADKLETERQDW